VLEALDIAQASGGSKSYAMTIGRSSMINLKKGNPLVESATVSDLETHRRAKVTFAPDISAQRPQTDAWTSTNPHITQGHDSSLCQFFFKTLQDDRADEK
jgi:hypothetical protein